MNKSIRLRKEKTGRITIVDEAVKHHFDTSPDGEGIEFGHLFKSLKEGDIIEITFENIRVCYTCGRELE